MDEGSYVKDMIGRSATGFILVVVGMLLSSAGLADDEAASVAEPNSSAPPSPSLEKLLEESGYAPRWRLTPPAATAPYTSEWHHPLADFEFQDSSGLARIARLRTLSFLTLSKSRQARLFFGVNEDGLVGLHYRAVSGNNDAHDPGRDRTPYFSDSPTAAEADPGTE